jgi:hypothetical protein
MRTDKIYDKNPCSSVSICGFIKIILSIYLKSLISQLSSLIYSELLDTTILFYFWIKSLAQIACGQVSEIRTDKKAVESLQGEFLVASFA